MLRALNEGGYRPHIPIIYRSAKKKHYHYVIMTLLSENLQNLKVP